MQGQFIHASEDLAWCLHIVSAQQKAAQSLYDPCMRVLETLFPSGSTRPKKPEEA